MMRPMADCNYHLLHRRQRQRRDRTDDHRPAQPHPAARPHRLTDHRLGGNGEAVGSAVGVGGGPAWATADQTMTATTAITRHPTTERRIVAFDTVAPQRARLAIIKDMRCSTALQPTRAAWQRPPLILLRSYSAWLAISLPTIGGTPSGSPASRVRAHINPHPSSPPNPQDHLSARNSPRVRESSPHQERTRSQTSIQQQRSLRGGDGGPARGMGL